MIPFPESPLWSNMREFYQREGIEAWSNQVPYFITSNAFLADSYFQVITTFWMESLLQCPGKRESPFLILELGTGPGLFSHLLLQRLATWQESRPEIDFVYVMSDLAEANLKFWQDHPKLQHYLDQGVLDFAIWDAEKGDTLVTERQSISISPQNKTKNELVVIANYLLDSLPHELIRYENGQFLRGWVPEAPELQTATEKDGFLYPQVEFRPLAENELCDNSELLQLLQNQYQETTTVDEFFLPTVSMVLMQQLRSFSEQALLFLVTDKGSSREHRDLTIRTNALAIHKSVSVDVPFSILAHWTKAQGGECIMTPTNQPVQNAGFFFAKSPQSHSITRSTVQEQFFRNSTGDIFNIFKMAAQKKNDLSLSELLPILNTARWDPFVFDNLFDSLLRQCDPATQHPFLLADCVDGIKKVADQYYYVPGGNNTLANIGVFFQHLRKFQLAILFYQRSLQEYADLDTIRFNIATCCAEMDNWGMAGKWYASVVEMNPQNFTALGLVTHSKKMAEAQVTPMVE